MSNPIESYGLIGDCDSAALVGTDGSIDWLCWPRFDSGSTFAAIVGDAENGRWLIGPAAGGDASSRRYLDNTLILETTFATEDGEVAIIDFMPPRTKNSDIVNSDIVRLVRGKRGRVKMRMELTIRFDYGCVVPWVRRVEDSSGPALLAIGGPDMVILHTPVETRGENSHTIAEFDVAEGQEVPFVLTYGVSHEAPPEPTDAEKALDDTHKFWSEWSAACEVAAKLRDAVGEEISQAVIRSLITLKALTYAPTGGIIAAPTTSLPEHIGGERNWDYRFCWLRDATLTLLTLMDAGYFKEAEDWRDWLLRAVAGSTDQIQIMYGVGGERRLTEWSVPWLAGYEGSRPVRIGNGAYDQVQLDVFGEVMDALHQARCGGLPETEPAWALEKAMIRKLARIWREPDEGIWEFRSERRHFTHSKIMAWVAVDRCIRSVEDFDLSGPVGEWRKLREEIHADVCANGYDKELGCFVQSYGSQALDASLLLIPTLGFLPASDPRFRRTVEAIEERLCWDGLVHRYDPEIADDGLKGGEGAFLACSFWLADAYVMLDRTEDAWRLFRHLLGLRNDLGLLSEEYDGAAKRQLGNFPQAFSHVTLVDTALRLAKQVTREERAPALPEEGGQQQG